MLEHKLTWVRIPVLTEKVSEQKLIPGRFYGGSVQGQLSLSAVVQPGASIMRKMIREVLGSNPGPDRKNVGIGFRPTGIPWGVNSRSQRIPIRLGSRLWNDPQTNKQTNKPTLLFLPRLFDGKDPSANAAGNVFSRHEFRAVSTRSLANAGSFWIIRTSTNRGGIGGM